MSSRKERRERSSLLGACPNCKEKGARHFAPPGFGSPGMFICEKKEEVREAVEEAQEEG